MLPPLTSANSMRAQIKTSPVSNYVARGEAISSQGGRKSGEKARHGEAAAAAGESWARCPHGRGRPSASAMGTVVPAAASSAVLPADTHIQLPEERLQLVSVLELRAEFLVQVCIHLLQKLLSILSVLLKLQKGKDSCERLKHGADSPWSSATRTCSGHLDTQNMWRKARDHYFPCSGHQIEGNNNQELLIPCRAVKSHLSLPSVLFHWDSITTVCGASTARARRRQSQALPHTNHPLGQLFWQIPTKGTAWAGHHGSALARDSSGGEHTQAVGEESSPTCSPAEPPWLSDAIYPADICLPHSAGTLSPCAGLQLCWWQL